MRRRLVVYFDRKNCPSPDELADETLNRVARRLEEEGSITTDTPAHYCHIVARFVFLEYLRNPELGEFPDDRAGSAKAHLFTAHDTSQEQREREKRLECLGRCLEQLEPRDRELISSYYTGEQRVKIDNRRALAARMAITMNALSIRACRIRDKLEDCVRKCLDDG
jgi:DNA-directed RNA polymerase specialized sigma24 family protein